MKSRAHGLLAGWPRLQPLLMRAQLWRWSRRSVAIGAAVGVFLGVMIPVAQMPAAAAGAALARGNLPVAMAATFITNPFTTPPLYYLMYLLGSWLTGNGDQLWEAVEGVGLLDRVLGAGSALLVGVPVTAVVLSALTYGAVNAIWRVAIMRRRPQLLRWARAYLAMRRRAQSHT